MGFASISSRVGISMADRMTLYGVLRWMVTWRLSNRKDHVGLLELLSKKCFTVSR